MAPKLPEDVSRDALSFMQRLLGPVADASDLLSDKIRFYRLKSALSIIEKAKDLSNERGIPINEVPLKFVIPFMELSSLEEENSDLSDDWARLLLSASEYFSPEKMLFPKILSEIGAAEANVLKAVVGEFYLKDSWQIILPASIRIATSLDEDYLEDVPSQDEFSKISRKLLDKEHKAPCQICEISSPTSRTGDSEMSSITLTSAFYNNNIVTLNILERQMLLKRNVREIEFRGVLSNIEPLKVVYYEATPLGVAFVEACEGGKLK